MRPFLMEKLAVFNWRCRGCGAEWQHSLFIQCPRFCTEIVELTGEVGAVKPHDCAAAKDRCADCE